MVTLCIAGGKKDKLRPGDLLGALTGDVGLQGSQVGKINVRIRHLRRAAARYRQQGRASLANGNIRASATRCVLSADDGCNTGLTGRIVIRHVNPGIACGLPGQQYLQVRRKAVDQPRADKGKATHRHRLFGIDRRTPGGGGFAMPCRLLQQRLLFPPSGELAPNIRDRAAACCSCRAANAAL